MRARVYLAELVSRASTYPRGLPGQAASQKSTVEERNGGGSPKEVAAAKRIGRGLRGGVLAQDRGQPARESVYTPTSMRSCSGSCVECSRGQRTNVESGSRSCHVHCCLRHPGVLWITLANLLLQAAILFFLLQGAQSTAPCGQDLGGMHGTRTS